MRNERARRRRTVLAKHGIFPNDSYALPPLLDLKATDLRFQMIWPPRPRFGLGATIRLSRAGTTGYTCRPHRRKKSLSKACAASAGKEPRLRFHLPQVRAAIGCLDGQVWLSPP